jgi:Sec-independent protein secretion pathway component TatC
MIIMALPTCLLYEASIWTVKWVEKKKKADTDTDTDTDTDSDI